MVACSPTARILVTGANGFVGRHLLPVLRAAFPQGTIVAAVRIGGDTSKPVEADLVVPFDLLDSECMRALIVDTKPNGLVHLAAQASVAESFENPLANWHTNVLGTLALGEAVLQHAPESRFVLASSAEVYGLSFSALTPLDETALLLPANPYAASKAACDIGLGEMTLRGLDAVRLRAFNHTGAGQSPSFVVAAFARQIARIEFGLQEPVLRVGSLDRWRDFVDVRDICVAYAAALCLPDAGGSLFNLASGVPRRIGDILVDLLARTKIRPEVEAETGRLRRTEVVRVAGNAARAQRELGWVATVPWGATLDAVLDDWRNRVKRGQS